MKKTAAIATFGCKTNQFESAVMEETLAAGGYEVVPFGRGADLTIVNTCTVTAATDAQSRNLIRRAHHLNPHGKIIVTGCYAQLRPDAFRNFPGVVLVLGNEEKYDLRELLADDLTRQRVMVSDIRALCRPMTVPGDSRTSRSRAFLQIQNGCDAFCSYCIIPYVRGPSRSLPLATVFEQADALAREGFEEIVLTGIHLGRYGADLSPAVSLTDLVAEMASRCRVRRVRIGSIEPNEITGRLIDLMAESIRICPHFHIPLQSGDDRILRAMRRPYDRRLFQDVVLNISARVPHVAIGADVIAGFPGETDREFRNTLDLIESLPLSYLHVFPFSPRPGTAAAGFSQQVDVAEIKARAARLRQLGEAKEKRFMSQYIGKTLEVIVEGGDEDAIWRGLTPNYLKVAFPRAHEMKKRSVQVCIEQTGDGELKGVPVVA